VSVSGLAGGGDAREEAVGSDEVWKLPSVRQLIDVLLAKAELLELEPSFRSDDPRPEVVKDVVEGCRAERLGAKAVNDGHSVELHHPPRAVWVLTK
jgi:hypothetical protein